MSLKNNSFTKQNLFLNSILKTNFLNLFLNSKHFKFAFKKQSIFKINSKNKKNKKFQNQKLFSTRITKWTLYIWVSRRTGKGKSRVSEENCFQMNLFFSQAVFGIFPLLSLVFPRSKQKPKRKCILCREWDSSFLQDKPQLQQNRKIDEQDWDYTKQGYLHIKIAWYSILLIFSPSPDCCKLAIQRLVVNWFPVRAFRRSENCSCPTFIVNHHTWYTDSIGRWNSTCEKP